MHAFIYLERFPGPFEIWVKASFASWDVTKQGVALWLEVKLPLKEAYIA